MKKLLLLTVMGMTQPCTVFAATQVSLNEKPIAYLQRFIQQQGAQENQIKQHNYMAPSRTSMSEIKRGSDIKQTTHIRLQQKVNGLPIWNAQAIVHMPVTCTKNLSFVVATNDTHATMTGKLYEGVEQDLASINTNVLNANNQSKAILMLQQYYHDQFTNTARNQYKQARGEAIVYLDKMQRARYGFLVTFLYDDHKTGARRPTAIVDAENFSIVKIWDAISHYEKIPDNLKPITAGGIGGNGNTGIFIYDNAKSRKHRATVPMSVYHMEIHTRGLDMMVPICYLLDDDVIVYDLPYDRVAHEVCLDNLPGHKNLPWLSSDGTPYWSEDSANGAKSPSLDAYYAAHVVKAMYEDWYHIPVVTDKNGHSKQIVVRTHYGRNYGNAYWDVEEENITFGDGDDMMYPLTLLGIMAHEVSHGFTTQHANFDKSNLQSAALHESFSDMADKAAEFYHDKKNIWRIGHDVFKDKSMVARYLDDPTQDHMSIAHMKDYVESDNPFEDPHLRAGIFNKAFYLIATSEGWDTHKAFDVMVQANRFYWTPSSDFKDAACGVLRATKDLGYNEEKVKDAFANVGLDTVSCTRKS